MHAARRKYCSLALTITISETTMRPCSVLSTVSLALSRLAWAAEPAGTTSSPQANIVLAAHLGPYPVSIYDHEVKTMRPDPLAPTSQLRRLMVTVYRPFLDNFTCPIEHQALIPYVPPVVATALLEALPVSPSSSNASASVFASVKLVNCSRPVPPSSPSGPLLLFSHGYGATHHIYASIVQAAASSGYTVVSIDHTYEAAAVVFPDGYVAYPSAKEEKYDNSTQGQVFLQSVRDADAVSVLDAIERGEVPGLGHYSNSSSSTNSSYGPQPTPLRAIMYGHSFGGSTAANVAFLDSRILAAGNIDGFVYPLVINGTLRKPLLGMASTPQELASNWPDFYTAHLRGWKTWVRTKTAGHYGYTDLPLLADLLGLRGTVVPESLIGTADGRRLQEIVWRYTLQFFAYVLKGTTPDLLDGPSVDFPDVEFVEHAEAGTGS